MLYIALFFTLFCSSIHAAKNIYFVNPFSPEDYNDGMFYDWNGWGIAKKAAAHLGYHLTSMPVPKKKNKNVYALVYFDKLDGSLAAARRTHPHAKIVTFLWEPPATAPYNYDKQAQKMADIILTWHDDMIDNKKYFKFLYTQPAFFLREPQPYHTKKFCCVMAGNKSSAHPDELYSWRRKTIEFFETHAPDKLCLYGPGWNSHQYKTYKGFVADKMSVLGQYKFCICYENIKNIPGYVSEKILHCLFVGCVPIYWGASNITKYIPQNCFIDRKKFATDAELYHYLAHMPESEYQQYINNIQAYFKSDLALLFSQVYFAECILKAIIPEYDRKKAFTDKEITLLKTVDRYRAWPH